MNTDMEADRRFVPEARLLFLAPAETQTMGGVLRFSRELTRALEPYAAVSQASVFPHHENPTVTSRQSHGTRALLRGTWSLRERVRHMESEGLIDGVFSSFHWPPRLTREVQMIGFVHDLRFLGAHNYGRISQFDIRARAVLEAIASWDVCTAPSEHVADDLDFHLPWVHVRVIGEGVDHLPRLTGLTQARTVLIVTGTAAHKRPQLAKALAIELAKDHEIVVRTLGLSSGSWAERARVKALQGLTDAEVAIAMAESSVVVFTTAYEGFGLAVGEALWQGVGVVYDRHARLDDLVGSAGLSVDGSFTGFVDGTREALSRVDELSASALEVGSIHTWDQVARRLASIVKSAQLESPKEQDVDTTDHLGAPYWSVLIPTYNRAETLPGCISSVLSQTDCDFECIVVDDGSSDNTHDVMAAFSDKRLRYLRLPTNQGSSAARNVAIRAASAPFLAFLDSDDFWLPTKLEVCRSFLEGCTTEASDERLLIHSIIIDRNGERRDARLDASVETHYLDRVLQGEILQTSGLVMSRGLALQTLFSDNLAPYEDWDFVARSEQLLDGRPLSILNHALSVHRADDNVDRLSLSPRRRSGGREFLERHGPRMNAQQRARFWILRQLHDEAEAMSNVRLFRSAVSHAVRGRPLRKAHYISLALVLSRNRALLVRGSVRASSLRSHRSTTGDRLEGSWRTRRLRYETKDEALSPNRLTDERMSQS